MSALVGAALAALLASGARAGSPGAEGAAFSRLGGDARVAALGAPGLAVSEGLGAAFGNPAAAAIEPDFLLGWTHLEWFAGFFGETVVAQMPAGPAGIVGVSGFVFTNGDEIPASSELVPGGDGSVLRYFSADLSLLGAQWFTAATAVGVSLRVLHQELGEDRVEALAVDAGIVCEVSPELAAGLGVRGLGRQVRASAERDPLPLLVNAGVRYAPAPWPVAAYAGGTYDASGPSEGGVGAEVSARGVAIRAMGGGRETGELVYAFGVGVRREMWGLDYTFAPAAWTFAHRITLSVHFARRGP